MDAFHTLRVRGPRETFALEDFELFTLTLSALEWRKHNGSIKLVTDCIGVEYLYECGLSEAWNETEILLDEMDGLNINEDVFWAGAKIYALSKQDAPCVMMDLDFILWKPLNLSLYDKNLAVIHREDIYSPVYPSEEHFRFIDGWQLPKWLDWSERPCNGALVYFGSRKFIREYTAFALEFMQMADMQDDRLSCMVFIEQRWMSMCAKRLSVPIYELSSMAELFSDNQKYFTHLWGYKQILRDNPAQAEQFCRDCAKRLVHDFPEFADKLMSYSWFANYNRNAE